MSKPEGETIVVVAEDRITVEYWRKPDSNYKTVEARAEALALFHGAGDNWHIIEGILPVTVRHSR